MDEENVSNVLSLIVSLSQAPSPKALRSPKSLTKSRTVLRSQTSGLEKMADGWTRMKIVHLHSSSLQWHDSLGYLTD